MSLISAVPAASMAAVAATPALSKSSDTSTERMAFSNAPPDSLHLRPRNEWYLIRSNARSKPVYPPRTPLAKQFHSKALLTEHSAAQSAMSAKNERVTAHLFIPHPAALITVTNIGTLHVYKYRQQRAHMVDSVQPNVVQAHSGQINGVCLVDDIAHRLVATFGSDMIIRVWDVFAIDDKPTPQRQIRSHRHNSRQDLHEHRSKAYEHVRPVKQHHTLIQDITKHTSTVLALTCIKGVLVSLAADTTICTFTRQSSTRPTTSSLLLGQRPQYPLFIHTQTISPSSSIFRGVRTHIDRLVQVDQTMLVVTDDQGYMYLLSIDPLALRSYQGHDMTFLHPPIFSLTAAPRLFSNTVTRLCMNESIIVVLTYSQSMIVFQSQTYRRLYTITNPNMCRFTAIHYCQLYGEILLADECGHVLIWRHETHNFALNERLRYGPINALSVQRNHFDTNPIDGVEEKTESSAASMSTSTLYVCGDDGLDVWTIERNGAYTMHEAHSLTITAMTLMPTKPSFLRDEDDLILPPIIKQDSSVPTAKLSTTTEDNTDMLSSLSSSSSATSIEPSLYPEYLFTSSNDHSIRSYQLNADQTICAQTSITSFDPTALCCFQSSKPVCVSGHENGSFNVWKVDHGSHINVHLHQSTITSLTFIYAYNSIPDHVVSSDTNIERTEQEKETITHRLIATCFDGNLSVWDMNSYFFKLKQLQTQPRQHPKNKSAYTSSPSSSSIIGRVINVDRLKWSSTANDNGAVGPYPEYVMCASEEELLCSHYVHETRTLLTSGADRIIRCWDIDERVLVASLSGHDGSVNSLSNDGPLCVSGSDDGDVRIWSLYNHYCLTVISSTNITNLAQAQLNDSAVSHPIKCVLMMTCSEFGYIAACATNGKVYVYDYTQRALSTLTDSENRPATVAQVDELQCCSLGVCVHIFHHSYERLQCAVWDANHQRLLVATESGRIIVYSLPQHLTKSQSSTAKSYDQPPLLVDNNRESDSQR